MIAISKIRIPANKSQDLNQAQSTWINGKLAALDEGTHITFFIGHETVPDDESSEPATVAFPVRVAKPVSRDMAINAAEMSAYGLRSAMEVASFNASLGRKYREDLSDSEVAEHDLFIAWAKAELTAIGV